MGWSFGTERGLLLSFAGRSCAARDRHDLERAAYWADCATWARNALARCLDMDAS